MATEVLRPQDVMLVNRFRVHTTPYHRRRNLPTSGGFTRVALDQQRRPSPPTKHDKRRSAAEARKSNQDGDRSLKGEMSGGATLLRRGQSLMSLPSVPIQTTAEDSEEILPKKIRLAPAADIYAGAGFEASPSPRCLPLPTFFNKKGDEHEPFEDGATRYLRRMLRLE